MEQPTEEDLNWPARFREAEENYAQFYTQRPTSISVLRLYASDTGDLESVGRTRETLVEPGTFSDKEIAHVIAKGASVGDKRYSLTAGGVFTVAIEPESVESFVATDWEPNAWVQFDVNSVPSINLPDTVHALGKETTLILVYRRRARHARRQTARRDQLQIKSQAARTTRRSRKGLKKLVISS